MAEHVRQGDIIKTERIKDPILVVSKGFFNSSGEIIGCPILEKSSESPLHIYVKTDVISGYVQCEKLTLLDLAVRRYHIMDQIPLTNIINITDAIQAIFDYI